MSKKEQSSGVTVLKMIGNIISWTLLVLLIIVAVFLLYYIISTQLYATKGEEYAPKYSLYTIISPSMTPNINVYDIIIDKRVDDYSKLEVGDVITFISTSSISSGMTITHRIVDIIETDEGTKYKTKGDNNLTADYALVTQDKIIGKVQFRLPQLGRIQFFLSSKGGWLLVILIPALIIILGDVFKLVRLFDIKKRVTGVKNLDDEEEFISQEQRVEEHKRQQQLKKKLQAKSNKSKYTRSEFESDGFLLPSGAVHISVGEDGLLEEELSHTGENRLLVELEEHINKPTIIRDSINEYIDETPSSDKIENNTVFEDFIKELKSEEVTPVREEPNVSALRALFEEEEEEIELPKTVEIKEEEIPDDLELPTIANDQNK